MAANVDESTDVRTERLYVLFLQGVLVVWWGVGVWMTCG
ncbi:MAG: hypothetical protein JWM10_165 [Myxococcaceae bacterium]|nr:hypothetical protein [Myxococcaceae bacterium]